MIFAYVTICILQLQTCAPETVVKGQSFTTETECWEAVNDFMDHTKNSPSPIGMTFRCAGET